MFAYSLKTIFIFLLLSWRLSGQTNYLVDIQRYTINDGLSHNHVYQTFQDSRGIIWVVTGSGIDRFDGRIFERILSFQISSFPFNLIAFEDNDGELWLRERPVEEPVSSYKLLNIFTGKVRTPVDKYGTGFPNRINNLVKAKNNSFLIATSEGELLRYNSNRTIDKLYQERPGMRVLREEPFSGNIWIDLPGAALNQFNIQVLNAQGQLLHNFDLPGAAWISSYAFPDQKFWYASLRELGNLQADGSSRRIPHGSIIQPYDTPLFTNRFFGVAGTDTLQHNFWLNYRDKLIVYNPEKGVVYDFFKQAKQTFRSTYNIFIDNRQIAWIGTIEGLYKVHLRPNRFRKLFWRNPEAFPDQMPSCRGMFTDNAGQLYATVDSCLWRVEGERSKVVYCYPVDFLYAAAMDETGNIWVKNHRLNPETGHVDVFPIDKPGAVAWTFFPDHDKIWMGRQFWNKDTAPTFSWLDRQNGSLHEFTAYNGFDTLRTAEVYFMQKDENGIIWLATNLGVFSLDKQKGITGRYWTGGKGIFHLPVDNIRHFYRENNDWWWLATDNGLLHWEKNKGIILQFTTANGLSNNRLYAVYPDDYGFLWLSSDYGIMQFQKSSGRVRLYTTADGISHNEFNRISHHQALDGTIYFGGLNGLTAFHPKDFFLHFEEEVNIPINLTECHLFSKKTNREEDIIPLFYQNKGISLLPGDQYLSLQFALAEYIQSNRIEYVYRLEGLNDNWITIKESRLQLAGLPYGDLTLVVRGKGANGIFSKQELRIPIFVLRPFYLQWWFVILGVSVAALSIFLFFRNRTRQLQQRQIVLEKQVRERTEKIRQDKMIIEKQAEKLLHLDEMKSRFFANISHELRTPLTLMLAPISSVLKKNQLDAQDASLLHKASRNGKNLLQMINDILKLVKLESDKLDLHEQATFLYPELRRLVGNFESLAAERGIYLRLQYMADQRLSLQLDRAHFATIINNLLTNALKFTDKTGEVVIEAEAINDQVRIRVRDTGRGIHPDEMPHIFDRFYQSHRSLAAEGGAGIGLALCVETAHLFQGKIWAESIYGVGSVFFLEFPLKENSDDLSPHYNMENENEWLSSSVFKQAGRLLIEGNILETMPGPIRTNTPSRPTLLLVEDNYDLREYIQSILNDEYEVHTAENGQEALVRLEQYPHCQLIISDIMMPLMDGFQLLEQLRSDDTYRHVPFILLTARAGMEDKLRALRIGVDDYLTKPFDEEELQVRIHNLLERQALRRNFQQNEEEITSETSSDEQPMTSEDMAWLESLELAAANHIMRPDFTVDQLADRLFMARTTFYDRVNRLTGLTPHQYLHEMRLAKAQHLLNAATYRTVKELAYAVGFKDEKYFSRQFKKRFGKSPSAY